MMYLPHQRHSSIMRDRESLNQKEPWPFSFALRPFCSAKPAVVGRYLQYAASAEAYAMFATCTGSAKHGVVAACPSEHSPPIVREKQRLFLSDCSLQICGFSARTGDALGSVSANALPCLPFTGAWHAPVIAPKEK